MPSLTSSPGIVNTTTAGSQFLPTAAVLTNGNQLLVWYSRATSGTGYPPTEIRGQLFNPNGAPVGGEFLVATANVDSSIERPFVAPLANGGFGVVWTSHAAGVDTADVYLQRFDASASPLGGSVLVNTSTAHDQYAMSVAPLANGGFVAAYITYDSTANPAQEAFLAQRFDSAGSRLGSEITLVPTGPHSSLTLEVAGLADGGFLAEWARQLSQTAFTFERPVYRYDSSGAQAAGPLAEGQYYSMLGLPDGGFLLGWSTGPQNPSGFQIHLQRYGADGRPAGATQVTSLVGFRSQPELDLLSDGTYLMSYVAQVGSSAYAFAQRFDQGGVKIGEPIRLDPAGDRLCDVATGGSANQVIAYGGNGASDVIARSFTLPLNTPGPGRSLGVVGSSQQHLTGGAGADTLTAGYAADVLSGVGGADTFVFQVLPWQPGQITDFTLDVDRLDVSRLLAGVGYAGSDPVADGYIRFDPDGAGGARVLFDPDGWAAGATGFTTLTTLLNVPTTGLTWAKLNGGSQPPPPSGDGRVIDSPGPGSTLVGGNGNDTLNASQGPDVLTGGGGGDAFVYRALPWNAGRITDFALGVDRIDLSSIFQAGGYTGSDPVADGRMRFESDGAGGTRLYFDRDAPNAGDWPFLITTLQNLSPAGLTWAQLSGGGGGDHFAWAELPWNAGHVTDFTPGLDKLDLRALFRASGYSGSNPIADGRLEFRSDGAGNTSVYFDADAPGAGEWPWLIATLDRVSPAQIGSGDWLFR